MIASCVSNSAMFFEVRHVFIDAPLSFLVFGLHPKFWEQVSLGIYTSKCGMLELWIMIVLLMSTPT